MNSIRRDNPMIKRKSHGSRFGLRLAALILSGLVWAGCTGPVKPDNGFFSTGMSLEKAVLSAQEDLGDPAVHLQFELYFQRLLEIAQGNPNPENRRLFSQFLVWANHQGIVTLRQSQAYYNRYFNVTFMSLPDDYSVSASCPDKSGIVSAMTEELRQKEKGLVKACQDRERYYQAFEQYNTLLVILDATCLACAGRR
jgi:hypothetical protein